MSDFAYPLHEECGVFGIYDRAGTEDVAAAAYSALYALQHRGQESCGIAVNDDGVIQGHRDLGLVNEVFTPAVLGSLSTPTAHMATGHVRYATAGSRVRANAQPMIVRHGRGTMALCHNGNLTNAVELRRQLENEGAIFHGSSDTEVICYLITRNRLRMGSIETAISKTMDVLEGAYSLVIMSATKLIAVRDPRGYRPLCIGTLPGGGYVFASESCALDAAGATLLRDVEPGEIVIADTKTGELRSIKDHCGRPDTQMCVFEFIYFSRPDSIIEGSSVHEARKQAGRFLAQEHPVEADVVIGVPDSGLDAALGYAEESGIPYGMGFVKNRYIARTFIQPEQGQRENSVRIKLNALASVVKGKRVVMVDDSIVRGTTLRRSILRILGRTNPRKIVIASTAPQIRYPDCYGIDMSELGNFIAFQAAVSLIKQHGQVRLLEEVYKACREELAKPKEERRNCVKAIYEGLTEAEISREITRLVTPHDAPCPVEVIFQTIENLHESIEGPCGDWYFTGDYPTPGGYTTVNVAYMRWFEGKGGRAYDLPL